MEQPPIRVAVLDDHEFILRSLQALADAGSTPFVVTTAHTDAEDFVRAVRADRPDVAIVDLMMDGRVTGHLTISRLTAQGVACVVFTADHRRIPVRLAMQAGARGLVLKSDSVEQLQQAIVDVAETGWAQSSALASVVLEASVEVPDLTPQELSCLRLASEGVPIKAIGRQLTPPISLGSVKTYLARAYEKYAAVGRQVSNTTQAAVQAATDGWFDI